MNRKKRSTHLKMGLVGLLTAISYQAVGQLSPQDSLSRDWKMSLERNLDKLEESGRIDAKNYPWSDSPWRASSGSLLNRYKREDLAPELQTRQRSLSLDAIQKLSPEERTRQIELQSPAEIFDLVRGLSLYPFTQEMRRVLTQKKNNLLDEQMNFGWAAAATSFREPDAIKDFSVRIPPRITAKITIGSSDVKGLVAYYYGVKMAKSVEIVKVGNRCQGASDTLCKRIDAASFHILLGNMIQSKGKPFIIDIDPTAGVNYRPVVAYESKFRPGAQSGLDVTTTVEFIRSRAPQIEPFGMFNLDTEKVEYRYHLELDQNQNITSGKWLSEERPEFAWRVLSLPHVDHEGFSALKDLYREAPLN